MIISPLIIVRITIGKTINDSDKKIFSHDLEA
jgi:hypothetical protein